MVVCVVCNKLDATIEIECCLFLLFILNMMCVTGLTVLENQDAECVDKQLEEQLYD